MTGTVPTSPQDGAQAASNESHCACGNPSCTESWSPECDFGKSAEHTRQVTDAETVMITAAAMPEGSRYSIEPHGDGFALYSGRTAFHHGLNLAHITEVLPETLQLIESSLNSPQGGSEAVVPLAHVREMLQWAYLYGQAGMNPSVSITPEATACADRLLGVGPYQTKVPTALLDSAAPFQDRVHEWMLGCFGE